MTIIFPVACDIVRNGETIELGFESKCSCDKAREVAKFLRPWSYLVTPSAREAPGTSDPVSKLMLEYLVTGYGVPSESVCPLIAETFNTEGEVLAIIKFIKSTPAYCEEIVICCKWWHMPRTWALMKFHLWKAGMKIRVSTRWCKSKAMLSAILMEFIGAWPLNIFRIGKRRITTGRWSV